VDRLTTGRRHVRAGSVTVTELLSRQASPTHCSSPTAPDNKIPEIPTLDDEDAVTDTIPAVVEAAHRREPARGVQLVKLASLGVAGVVLCGAVTISSVVAHQRREAANTAARPSMQITGGQALLPDKLAETLPEGATPVATPVRDRPFVAPDSSRDEPTSSTSAREPATPLSDTGTTASSGGTTLDPVVSAEDLVRKFYANLPDSPAAAFDLLSPDVLDASLGEFLDAWSKVTAIDSVKVTQRADGVHATVRMRLLGGGQLLIEQLLTVAESPRRITGVQLLSAQRN
jgi:hypothetical protein